ncbi:TraM recognition domain-containing protein [Pontibacter mangrovi]|uniref:Type IV secretory system conjugative DNA transfer family protein n=1 Tax=Pontibacter mangrovi TaxID=2589816 RepID=A0A501VUH2_9BACT|nr:TraM recognition domain-containing protein [Pontibacter mangrovi]TPE39720.1 type IV secretory system conjugative DNA transfer family protein [Pontibacter mangrovi]
MEESSELKKLYSFLQGTVYLSVALELALFLWREAEFLAPLRPVLLALGRLPLYRNVYYAKAFTLGLIFMVSLGTKAQKQQDLHPLGAILLPLLAGSAFFFGSGLLPVQGGLAGPGQPLYRAAYAFCTLTGAVLIHLALDNVSKRLQHRLLQDRFNVENESFAQPARRRDTPYSVNLPMRYYYRRGVRRGWLNVENPFRGTLLIGTPGSGKSFSVVLPFIRQLLGKGFAMMVYDFKFPDLARAAYAHFLACQCAGKLPRHRFHVINFHRVEYSRRINPLRPAYLATLADATETAEALLEALRKGDRAGGVAQFFNQSAVNLLASCMYFLSRHDGGRYSTFPHVLALLNLGYGELFETLFSEPELESLLSPFATAYRHKAFEQLEGQVGGLKVTVGRLATKETFWVLSGDEVDLHITNPAAPSLLVIANDPSTQSINSACNALVLNRLTRLINTKGNLPGALIVDESPTLYLHRVENLIATARSNRIAVLLGLQELPQLRQQYGRETADTICAVTANVLSGSARHRETLDWLEKLFGRVRQLKQGLSLDRSRTAVSLSEEMGPLIPASRIAGLQAGEVVGQLATESGRYEGKPSASVYHCKIDLDPVRAQKAERQYLPLPLCYYFGSEAEKDRVLRENFRRINQEVKDLVARLRAS